ncbi:hypothetical protein [Aidingimonas lacisalsi]|uniref:hypothetical protein n=1 Tax=Aidingimonas lacisalsi TaxID=2604086 RepID=UPI0011D261CF|nr:hypothetical protein [Aidingimonas lacisalsi]
MSDDAIEMQDSRTDQAAGLRRWAGERARMSPPSSSTGDASTTLMVVGLPDTSNAQTQRVIDVLAQWHDAGQQWIGDPAAWRVVGLDANTPHLAVLAEQQSRWALWVDEDPDGFRRAYRVLKQLSLREGPRRLLAVHPGFPSSRGLLNNLREAAGSFLGIELLVLARR